MGKKHVWILAFVFAVILGGALVYYGCGRVITSPGSVSSQLVNQAKAGAFVAGSGNNLADAASSVSTSVGGAGIGGTSVKAVSGPPSTFFSAIPTDGYVQVTAFHASENVKVRYITKDGTPVTASYISDKSIAKLGDFNWDNSATGSRPTPAQALAFANSPSYEALASVFDYIAWSHIAGQMEEGFRSNSALATLLGTNHLTSPSPEANDRAGSMEGVVTISGGGFSGSLIMNLALSTSEDEYAMPVSAAGSGVITVEATPPVTLDSSMVVTFTSEGSNESLTLTGTTPDGYSVSVTCGSPESETVSDGSGTGTIRDAAGTQVATIVIAADGTVTVTDSDGHVSHFSL